MRKILSAVQSFQGLSYWEWCWQLSHNRNDFWFIWEQTVQESWDFLSVHKRKDFGLRTVFHPAWWNTAAWRFWINTQQPVTIAQYWYICNRQQCKIPFKGYHYGIQRTRGWGAYVSPVILGIHECLWWRQAWRLEWVYGLWWNTACIKPEDAWAEISIFEIAIQWGLHYRYPGQEQNQKQGRAWGTPWYSVIGCWLAYKFK